MFYLVEITIKHNTDLSAKKQGVELMVVDTTDATHYWIDATRGNGVNGGDSIRRIFNKISNSTGKTCF